MQVKVLYHYSSVVDLTERKTVATCSPTHCEPSPAAGAGVRRRWRKRCRVLVQGSNRTVVWYRRSQWGRDWWTWHWGELTFQGRRYRKWEKSTKLKKEPWQTISNNWGSPDSSSTVEQPATTFNLSNTLVDVKTLAELMTFPAALPASAACLALEYKTTCLG